MDRYEKGKKCLEDIQKAPVEELFKELEDIAPDLSRFVIEFPYSEIYTRSDVDLKTRELCTVAALTTLGTIPQLKDHINAALNVGNSPSEIVEWQQKKYLKKKDCCEGVLKLHLKRLAINYRKSLLI